MENVAIGALPLHRNVFVAVAVALEPEAGSMVPKSRTSAPALNLQLLLEGTTAETPRLPLPAA